VLSASVDFHCSAISTFLLGGVPYGICAVSGASMQASRMVLRLPPALTDNVSPSPTERTLACSANAVAAPIPVRTPQSIPAANKALLALTGAWTPRCCRRGVHKESRLGPYRAWCCQLSVRQRPERSSGRTSNFEPKPPPNPRRAFQGPQPRPS